MKNTLLGLFFTGLTAITNAQTHENHDSIATVKEQITTVLNPAYLHRVNQGINARVVNELELLAANYDITKAGIYEESATMSYNVRLGNGKNQIRAVFDHNGILVRTEEKYKDIVLPLSLRIAIAKKYPGWVFSECSYKLTYTINKEVERYCSMTLERGKKKMRIKFAIPTDNSFSESTRIAYGI